MPVKQSKNLGLNVLHTASSSSTSNQQTNQIISRFESRKYRPTIALLLSRTKESSIIFHSQFTAEQADQIQAEFIQQLIPHLGRPIGYKAGLTNPLAQKKFQRCSTYLRHVYWKKCCLNQESTVPANFGASSHV